MKRAFKSLKDGDRSFLLPFYPSFGKERLRDMVQTLPTPKQTSSLSLSSLLSSQSPTVLSSSSPEPTTLSPSEGKSQNPSFPFSSVFDLISLQILLQ